MSEGKNTSEHRMAYVAGAVPVILGAATTLIGALSKSLQGWQLVAVLITGLVVTGGGVTALAYRYIGARTEWKLKDGAK